MVILMVNMSSQLIACLWILLWISLFLWIDRDEFAIVKGKREIGKRFGKALIVATRRDNTEIYVNGETTPVVTLNEGGYYGS